MQTSIESDFSSSAPPSLSTFTDYREYLKSFYNYKRDASKGDLRPYSYAHFSAAADIKSPNYLKLIIEGQRNLSNKMVHNFSKALHLNKNQEDEFRALVEYSQAKEPLERNQCLKVLSDYRVQNQIKNGAIDSEKFESRPSWVTWALMALTDQKNINFDPEVLWHTLKGRARKDEIKKCLDKLLDSGQLVRDPKSGAVSKARLSVKEAEKIPVEAVKKLQAELIYLGLESLFNDEAKAREFGTLTMSLTEAEFKKLKFELRHFRKKIFKDVLLNRESGPGDRVFQLNLQLFELSNETSEGASDTSPTL